MNEADVDDFYGLRMHNLFISSLDTMQSLGQHVNDSKIGATKIEEQSILPTTLSAPAVEGDLVAKKPQEFSGTTGLSSHLQIFPRLISGGLASHWLIYPQFETYL
jgi:hypothetical protein